MDFARFLDVIRAFEREKLDYILVGGVAVNLHGVVRATEDIGFFVRPEPENVERLKSALRSIWDDPEIEQISAADFGSYPPCDMARRARISSSISSPGSARSFGSKTWRPRRSRSKAFRCGSRHRRRWCA